jgi:hypothetical protein
LAFALAHATDIALFNGEVEAACEQAEVMITHCAEHGIPSFLSNGTFNLGHTLFMQGQIDEGIQQMPRAQ